MSKKLQNRSREYICGYEVIKTSYKDKKNVIYTGRQQYMTIVRVKSGRGRIISKEFSALYSPGIFVVILSEDEYTIMPDQETDTIWEYVLIDEIAVGELLYPENKNVFEKMRKDTKDRIHVFGYLEKPQMGLSIRLLFGELQNREPMYKENSLGVLQVLLVYILRDFMKMEEIENEKNRRDEFDYILPSMQYIIDHYKEEIRISTLAKLCHVSESYYRDVFGKILHMTPLEYINNYRIGKACELLQTTNYSVEMISGMVGYKSITTFYRNFKNQKGCTPYQWKKDN